MTQANKLGGGSRFQPSDFSIARYAATVPSGTKLEDVLNPEYFQNHLANMRQGMEINVLSEDLELDCTLRVLKLTQTTAKLRVVRHYTGNDEEHRVLICMDDLRVEHAGPTHKWRVVHSGAVVSHGHVNREDADAAAEKYLLKVNS